MGRSGKWRRRERARIAVVRLFVDDSGMCHVLLCSIRGVALALKDYFLLSKLRIMDTSLSLLPEKSNR